MGLALRVVLGVVPVVPRAGVPMTAAVIALAAALAAALGIIAYQAIRLARVAPDIIAANKREIAADQRAESYRIGRDDLAARLAEASEREAAAIVRLKLTENRANKAAEEAARAVVEKVRTAPTARAAAAALDELLGAPILPASKAGEPGAGGDGT